MWTVRLAESERWYWLRGPVAQLGRAPDVALPIVADKSISRVHAQLELGSDGGLRVLDKGSRFGTQLDGVAIPLDRPALIAPAPGREAELLLGGAGYPVSIVRRQLKLCASRLDRRQKEQLKTAALALGAEVVTTASACTHLVCGHLSATVKVLAAICACVPLVSVHWLDFAANPSPAVPLPCEDTCAPLGDVAIARAGESRAEVCRGLCVLLLDESDAQYEEIIQLCGGQVLRVWCEMHRPWPQVLDLAARRAEGAQACVFFDENHGCPPDPAVQTQLAARSRRAVSWLTAAGLAKAVVTLLAPELLNELPRARQTQGASQYQSQVRASASQAWDALYLDPALLSDPQPEPDNAGPARKKSRAEAADLFQESPGAPPPRSTRITAVATGPLSTPKRAREDIVATLWDSEPPAKKPHGLPGPSPAKHPVMAPPPPAARAPAALAPPASVPTPAPAPVVVVPRSTGGGSLAWKARARVRGRVDDSDGEDDWAASLAKAETPTPQKPQKPQKPRASEVGSPPRRHEVEVVDLAANPEHANAVTAIAPIAPTVPIARPPAVRVAFEEPQSSHKPGTRPGATSSTLPSAAEVAVFEGETEAWICIDHSLPRLRLHDDDATEGRPASPALDEERELLVKPMQSQVALAAPVASAPSTRLPSAKRFVKNRVVAASQPLRLEDMDRVLPRETERELQLRMEFEALQRQEEEGRRMLAATGGVAPGPRPRRR